MNIERLKNDNGDFFCFEVENRIISRKGMAKVISKLVGVEILHYPKFYDAEVFCEFELGGHRFEITEPYGDSSVYDVCAPKENLPEMELVANHFELSSPIRGGDSAQRVFFLLNWFLFSFIILGGGYGILKGFSSVFS